MRNDRHLIHTRPHRLEHWLVGLICATAVLGFYTLSAGVDEAEALNMAEAEADRAAAFQAGRVVGREEALQMLQHEAERLSAQCQPPRLTAEARP